MEPERAGERRPHTRLCWTLSVPLLALACDKEVVVAKCAVEDGSGGADDGAADADTERLTIQMPWHSGFETGFCDFRRDGGYCYQRGTASYKLVTSPVHSGSFAAAFRVSSDTDASGTQARCVRQGVLPERAYYGAWYYVPVLPIVAGFWNLFHFEGKSPKELHSLWDVELTQGTDSQIRLSIYDFLRQQPIDIQTAPPIPIGKWFHVEFLFARASDSTGEIALAQDGVTLFDWTGVTDDSEWGQWFVGSLAVSQNPKETTTYVDDVTIDATP